MEVEHSLQVLGMVLRTRVLAVEEDGSTPQEVGKIDLVEGETYDGLRLRLEENEVVEWPFQFWDAEDSCRIKVKLERLNKIPPIVYVIPTHGLDEQLPKRRRVGDGSFVEDFVATVSMEDERVEFPGGHEGIVQEHPKEPASNSRVKVNKEGGVDSASTNLLQSTLISNEAMTMYHKAEQKLRKDLKDQTLQDHLWCLKSWDHNGTAIVKLYCDECDVLFGGNTGEHNKNTVTNLFSNFKRSHIGSNAHIRAWCRRNGVPWENHPQSAAKPRQTIILTVEDHRKLVREGIDIVDAVNDSVDSDKKPFKWVGGDVESPHVRSLWYRVQCSFCNEFFQLCPPKKNLEASLLGHLHGTKHAAQVEKAKLIVGKGTPVLRGKRGRPSRSSGTSSTSNQTHLHSFFKHEGDGNEEGEFLTKDRSDLFQYMCWGFRGPFCSYAGKKYEVMRLLHDSIPGLKWFPEPYIKGKILVNGDLVDVEGCFRHTECLRFAAVEPWIGLTCPMCARIPQENDFNLRVRREDRNIDKRGSRSCQPGRRLDYLWIVEVGHHSRELAKKFKLEKMYHWAAKARIVQLKVKRPTLREVARESSASGNVLKFCNDILAAHRSGAFGGKPALWDFMREVAANLNRTGRGHRFRENTKCFAETMRMFGGKRMCDLFALNYDGPSYDTVKRDTRKGVHFVSGEHAQIFSNVADIYRKAKEAHGIVGPVPIILAEDETKVKGRISWERKTDALVGFCGSKENHVCKSGYKIVVGSGEAGYSKIVDSFQTNKVGGFARVIMVNPLHNKLPRLVLVVCCTCGCFNSD